MTCAGKLPECTTLKPTWSSKRDTSNHILKEHVRDIGPSWHPHHRSGPPPRKYAAECGKNAGKQACKTLRFQSGDTANAGGSSQKQHMHAVGSPGATSWSIRYASSSRSCGAFLGRQINSAQASCSVLRWTMGFISVQYGSKNRRPYRGQD